MSQARSLTNLGRGASWSVYARTLTGRVFRWASFSPRASLIDSILLVAVEAVVLQGLGLLTNSTPVGDDYFIHIQKVIDLSKNFLHFQWNPTAFNGYIPSTGFAWMNYAPPAFLVFLGLDPTAVFHATFVAYFLAFGPSVYYFGRMVGAERIVSIALSALAWSTIGYLGYLGGGAFDRLFTLPLMFIALALTYRYASLQNSNGISGRFYWILLATWIATLLGDIYISAVPFAIAVTFLLLSAGWKHLRIGALRLAAVMVPSLALTSWFWIPLLAHVTNIGSPRSDLTVSLISQLFWLGPIFTAIVFFLRKSSDTFETERAALLLSLNLVAIYFLAMGAITPLWPYLPRIWSTYDSFDILSFVFPAILACLFGWVNPLKRDAMRRYLAIILVILVILNALPTIDLNKPHDWTPLNNTLIQALNGNLATSNDYRVSLQGRSLTRIFPFYFPDAYQAGGRTLGLDSEPYYQSWYDTEAFFKDDLSQVNTIYIEDQPTFDVTSLIGGPQNFASTEYWLDWYGVDSVVLETAFYPVNKTSMGYSQRGALFATKVVQTSYGPLFFANPVSPGPILSATNATTLGFYSQQNNSLDNYRLLLALLSYLGLDSRHVVPLYLTSLDGINPGSINAIITDQATYDHKTAIFSSLQSSGVRIIPIPETLLTTLQTKGPAGAVGLLDLLSPTIPLQMQNLTQNTAVLARIVTISPGQWSISNKQNANVQLGISYGNLTLTVNIPDPTTQAQFSLGTPLPEPAVLSNQLVTNVAVESNVTNLMGFEFTSNNFTSNYVESRHTLNQSSWANFVVPFSNFTLWANPIAKFALASGFNITFTIPPGHANVALQIGAASIMEPGYNLYRPPGSVSISAAGFLQVSNALASSLILSDARGGRIGSYDAGNNQASASVIPLGSFNSTMDQAFTEALIIGGTSGETVTLGTVPEATWTPLESTWATKQNSAIQTVPRGFRGIVWKEIFTNNWEIRSINSATTSALPYFYAGPGMVYIPTSGVAIGQINLSYQDIVYSIAIPSLAAVALIPLAIFRRRIYRLGEMSSAKQT